jgi:hypothetical protein
MPLDQLLKDEEFPETERLLRSTGLKHLNQVADRKGKDMAISLSNLTQYLFLRMKITANVRRLKPKASPSYLATDSQS